MSGWRGGVRGWALTRVGVLGLALSGAGCGDGAATADCEGDVWIRSASDVAALGSCTTIGGDLVVSAPDLEDLSGLEGLTAIGGALRIGSDEEVDLSGVAPGAVVEVGPTRLTSLHGLSSLRTIGGGLRIDDSPTVADIAECQRAWEDQITMVAGARALVTLDGLDALETIGGVVEGPFATAACGLSPHEGLPALDVRALDGVRVGGLHLVVSELPSVDVQPGADVWIARATTSLGDAAWPQRLGHLALDVQGGIDLTPLREVARVDRLELTLGRGGDTTGFEGLTSAGSVLVLAGDASGPYLSGLSSLATVDGDLDLDSVFCLAGLEGLEALTSVGGALTLYKTGVPSLSPLAALTSVGSFTAAENPLLDPGEVAALAARLGVPCGCEAPVPECRCEENGGSVAIDACF